MFSWIFIVLFSCYIAECFCEVENKRTLSLIQVGGHEAFSLSVLSQFRGITTNEIVRDSGIKASLQCLGLARQGGLGGFPRLNQTQKKSDTII